MAEQIPEAWIGQEVIVYFEPAHRQVGTLEDVSEKGIVVRSTRDETENVFWYPLTSVTRLLKDRAQGADTFSFCTQVRITRLRGGLLTGAEISSKGKISTNYGWEDRA